MREKTPIASQPSREGSQVLFRGGVFGETGPEAAGRVIDQRDQLASGAAVLQPTERGAILNHRFYESGHFYFASTGHSHFAATQNVAAIVQSR
jgi:hypothetical protein